MIKKYLSILLAFWLLASCNLNAQNGYITLSEHDFLQKLVTNQYLQLIDVRTPTEFEIEHIEKAKNINVNDNAFVSTVSKLDKSKPVFVYCKVGVRGGQAATKLIDLGFKEVYNLDGGIMKWKGKKVSLSDSSNKGYSLQDFERLTHIQERVLINFSAKWCAPCMKMKPYLTEMQENLNDKISIITLDADENKTLLEQLNLDGLPVLMLFENGKEKWRNIGYITEKELRKKL